jgi:hypothetical protein
MIIKRKNKRGFASILAIIIAVVVMGGGLFYIFQEKNTADNPGELKKELPQPVTGEVKRPENKNVFVEEPERTEFVEDKELVFIPDFELRIKDASLPSPSVDKSGKVYLYYEDTSTVRRGRLVATSPDGIHFSAGARQTEWIHDPRTIILPQPGKNGQPIYRRYFWDSQKNMRSESSSNGINFIQDDGIRYKLQPEDKGTVGITDFFIDSKGGIVLLYIGDMMGLNNIRRAYSPSGDNGENFIFDRDNVLGDAKDGGGPRSHVDQKSIILSDGRVRLFTMKGGLLFSFISEDDGKTFTLEPGIRLMPNDFKEFKVYSLHDPWVIQLPGGRYRMYVAAKITDTRNQFDRPPGDGDFAIISATTIE